jgi:hypothetical protein
MTHGNESRLERMPELVRTALDRAQQLADADNRHDTGWWQAATQAGDMSITAVALAEERSTR